MTGAGRGASLGGLLPRLYLVVMAACFAIPTVAIARLALRDDAAGPLRAEDLTQHWSVSAVTSAITDPQVTAAGGTTGLLVGGAVLVNMVLLVPLALVTTLRFPRLRPVVAALTLLPWIAPPIALVVGVVGASESAAPWLLTNVLALVPFYAMWAMPFTYRVLDSGLSQLGARRLYEAGRGLGASRRTMLTRVLLPGMRSPLLAAVGLTAATVLAEYAFASMLVQPTLSTVLVGEHPGDPRGSMLLALAVMILAGGSLLLLTLRSGPRQDAPDVR
jgi:putative spermidine/putrescine transport system permease protein